MYDSKPRKRHRERGKRGGRKQLKAPAIAEEKAQFGAVPDNVTSPTVSSPHLQYVPEIGGLDEEIGHASGQLPWANNVLPAVDHTEVEAA